MLGDKALILGLLNTLERELLPAIEGGEAQAWSRANRIADGVLALRTELARLGPRLRDLPWTLRGGDRWESTPYPVEDLEDTYVG